MKFIYSGQENLEAMTEARNYNAYLLSLLLSGIGRSLDGSKKSAKVLDFGAGIGTYADMLSEEGIKPDCLELDSDQITTLESKGYKVFDSPKALKQKYDMIYALNVFEHIENDIEVFAELTKSLKKGGVVVIYVPAMQSAFSSMDKLVGHYRRYNLQRLDEMAERSNMSVESLEYGDPIGLLAAYAYKLFGNKNGIITKRSVQLYDRLGFPTSKTLAPIFRKSAGKNAILIAKKN